MDGIDEILCEKDESGRTALATAAANGHRAACQLLLAKGTHVEAKDNYEDTPLALAAWYGHEDICKALLASGADVQNTNIAFESPLARAARTGHASVCKLLIEKGAQVESDNADGNTSLALAAMHGHESVCQLLLSNGANVDARNNADMAPLHIAAYFGQPGPCSVLLRAGAKVNDMDEDGHTALERAVEGGHVGIAKLMETYTPKWGHMAKWRRAVDAKRDAGRVFRAAAEGRPMELAKRLRLGKLAGGLEIKGEVEDGAGGTRVVGPIEAVMLGGHDWCLEVLEEAAKGLVSQS